MDATLEQHNVIQMITDGVKPTLSEPERFEDQPEGITLEVVTESGSLIHDGSRTPGQSAAWDPNNRNRPSSSRAGTTGTTIVGLIYSVPGETRRIILGADSQRTFVGGVVDTEFTKIRRINKDICAAAAGDCGVGESMLAGLITWIGLHPNANILQITNKVVQLINQYRVEKNEGVKERTVKVILGMMRRDRRSEEDAYLYKITASGATPKSYCAIGTGKVYAKTVLAAGYANLQDIRGAIQLVDNAVQRGIELDTKSGGIVRFCVMSGKCAP